MFDHSFCKVIRDHRPSHYPSLHLLRIGANWKRHRPSVSWSAGESAWTPFIEVYSPSATVRNMGSSRERFLQRWNYVWVALLSLRSFALLMSKCVPIAAWSLNVVVSGALTRKPIDLPLFQPVTCTLRNYQALLCLPRNTICSLKNQQLAYIPARRRITDLLEWIIQE
jgi:hypothetical protein